MKVFSNGIRTNYNFYRILRSIWLTEGISRIDICNKLGLDKATVSTVVSTLIQNELVEETQKITKDSKPGRKPIGLRINKDFGCIAGFEINLDGIKAVITDMHHNTIFEKLYPQKIKKDNIKSAILSTVKDLQKKQLCKKKKLLGIGVAIPGVVNKKKGTIEMSWELGILGEPYSIMDELQDQISIPIFLDNNANSCASGVLASQRAKEYKDFLFCYFNYQSLEGRYDAEFNHVSIGLGIVLNGSIYMGPDGSAGEFQAIGNNLKICQFNVSREELTRYEEDREVRKKIADEITQHLALLVNFLNFKEIFIGGSVEHLYSDTPALLKEALNYNWPYEEDVECGIHILESSNYLAAHGAAGMFLEHIFTIPLLSHDDISDFWRDTLDQQ